MATVKVYNRKLEQTLYNLGIHYLSCDKDEEDMTVWTYTVTEKTMMIINMFKEATEKRRKMGW